MLEEKLGHSQFVDYNENWKKITCCHYAKHSALKNTQVIPDLPTMLYLDLNWAVINFSSAVK